MDNYLDGGYHVSFLHKDLTTGLDINSYETEVGDRYSLQKCKGSDADNAGQKDRLGSSAVFAYLYPNMMINRYGPWMDTNVVFPISIQNIFFPPQNCRSSSYVPYFSKKYFKGDFRLLLRRHKMDILCQ